MALIGDHFLGEAQIECLRPRVTFNLCNLWRIRTLGGKVLRFASHDKVVYFEGEAYVPLGPTGSDLTQSEAGGSADFDIAGFLSHSTIRAKDIEAGLYDGATIDHWVIDWTRPWYWVRSHRWWIDRITVSNESFRAEINGVGKYLEIPLGRYYEKECDKEFGGPECSATPNVVSNCPVTAVPSASSEILGAASTHVAMTIASPNTGTTTADFWGTTVTGATPLWIYGKVEGVTGSNAGVTRNIALMEHRTVTNQSDHMDVLMDRSFPFPIRVGDQFTITSGCDGQFGTCKAVYGNVQNFGGVHRMPTTEDQYAAAEQGEYQPDQEV
jgi:hypothetical protein